MTTAVVSLSGGAASAVALERALITYDTVVPLFADTLIEDVDLYRFLDDLADHFSVDVVRIADGRDIWEVFRDARFLGTSRVDPCSRILKREIINNWIAENHPESVRVYGFTPEEPERAERVAARAGWECAFPLLDPPILSNVQIRQHICDWGIELPRLYRLGFEHNNCGGGCIKAGQRQFRHLYLQLPDVFAEWERREQEMRDYLGRDIAILRDRAGGETRPLTLAEFRGRVSQGVCDMFDGGAACDCMGATND